MSSRLSRPWWNHSGRNPEHELMVPFRRLWSANQKWIHLTTAMNGIDKCCRVRAWNISPMGHIIRNRKGNFMPSSPMVQMNNEHSSALRQVHQWYICIFDVLNRSSIVVVFWLFYVLLTTRNYLINDTCVSILTFIWEKQNNVFRTLLCYYK